MFIILLFIKNLARISVLANTLKFLTKKLNNNYYYPHGSADIASRCTRRDTESEYGPVSHDEYNHTVFIEV
jgi:hypothetical protein